MTVFTSLNLSSCSSEPNILQSSVRAELCLDSHPVPVFIPVLPGCWHPAVSCRVPQHSVATYQMRWRLTVSGSLTTDYHQRLTAWNGIIILPPFFHFWKNVSGFLSKQMPLCVVLSNQCYDGSPNNSWWCFCLYLIAPWWPSSCSFFYLVCSMPYLSLFLCRWSFWIILNQVVGIIM